MRKKNINKKDLMIKCLLINYKFYDMSIYKIIMDGCLDDIIESLDDSIVVSNVNKKEKVTPQEQFLGLLTRFISYFKKHFHNVDDYTDYLIIEIISANQEEFKDYLNQKMYLGDNKYIDYFKNILPKLSVLNFVKNSKLFGEIKEVFKNNKIKIKDINEYSDKDINKLFNLLCEIIECSDTPFWNYEFLMDYKYSEESGVKNILESKYPDKSEKTIKDFREAHFNHAHLMNESVLESYYKKIDTLNKLKNIE